MKRFFAFFLILSYSLFTAFSQSNSFKIAVLKYSGGGDWYANPTALPNLVTFCNKELPSSISQASTVDVGSPEIFNYTMLHLTGHGNIVFSAAEIQNLQLYLKSGGFLHIDDNYGMDPFVRPSMKRVFPELDFIELPFTHEIYHQKFDFPHGLPKIHKHEDKAPQGFGLIWQGRLVCFYSYECDLGDGWEDREVHKDTEESRINALRMGANLLRYVFQQ